MEMRSIPKFQHGNEMYSQVLPLDNRNEKKGVTKSPLLEE